MVRIHQDTDRAEAEISVANGRMMMEEEVGKSFRRLNQLIPRLKMFYVHDSDDFSPRSHKCDSAPLHHRLGR